MLWCLIGMLLLSCLSRTHHSSNELISTNHTHTVHFCMTLCRRSLNWVGNWPRIIITRFRTTRYVAWLYDYAVFTCDPRISDWWIVTWLEFAVADTFTVILIRVVLQTVKINGVSICRSSYRSRRGHPFILHLMLLLTIHGWVMSFSIWTQHHLLWTRSVAKTVLF